MVLGAGRRPPGRRRRSRATAAGRRPGQRACRGHRQDPGREPPQGPGARAPDADRGGQLRPQPGPRHRADQQRAGPLRPRGPRRLSGGQLHAQPRALRPPRLRMERQHHRPSRRPADVPDVARPGPGGRGLKPPQHAAIPAGVRRGYCQAERPPACQPADPCARLTTASCRGPRTVPPAPAASWCSCPPPC
ncbi:hypothetical protein SBRY_50377 [Actinacidiphila bryophytorum]|uniref:Uncharacterized protein n=1 Tax=Actinacidiphila bryophytorum TaxID=1436133 RepID=A0A9W4H4T1_9ACTN|nr:hypothetical protein SBRY_50377 [Actinacidiphila bryophytorum]